MKKRLSFLFAILVGAMFLVSGISKLLAIQPFEWQFIDLGLSGRWPSIAARTLVVLEIALGFFMITCQFLKNFTVPLTLFVLLVFSIYLGYDIALNGNNGDCGCFGNWFYMTPLWALVKNIIAIIMLLYIWKVPINPWKIPPFLFAATITMVSIASIFVLAPVNPYPKPIQLAPLYHSKQLETPSIDLTKGKHVLVFISATCPHCREAARQLQDMKNRHPDLPLYVIINGSDDGYQDFLKEFENQTFSVPHNRFKGPEEWLAMAGDYVPVVLYINNSQIIREVYYKDLSAQYIANWAQQN